MPMVYTLQPTRFRGCIQGHLYSSIHKQGRPWQLFQWCQDKVVEINEHFIGNWKIRVSVSLCLGRLAVWHLNKPCGSHTTNFETVILSYPMTNCMGLIYLPTSYTFTLQGTNIISHLWKRNIIFKSALGNGYVSSWEGIYHKNQPNVGKYTSLMDGTACDRKCWTFLQGSCGSLVLWDPETVERSISFSPPLIVVVLWPKDSHANYCRKASCWFQGSYLMKSNEIWSNLDPIAYQHLLKGARW